MVINTTSTKKCNHSPSGVGGYTFIKNALERMTIPTLTKLFVIRIVASRSLGLSSIDVAFSARFPVLSLSVSLSRGLSEKKAASDPETNAEDKSKIPINTRKMISIIPNPAVVASKRGMVLEGSIVSIYRN